MRAWQRFLPVIVLTAVSCGVASGEDRLAATIRALQSSRRTEQARALRTLEELGLDGFTAVPGVVPLLESRDRSLQAQAARVLAGMKVDAAPAIPALIGLLGASDAPWIMTDVGGIPRPGSEAVHALAAIGPDAVGPLTECLRHRKPVVRFQAAVALGEIGPAAKEAAPAMLKLLDDPHGAVRLQATWSLIGVVPGDEKATLAVIARMKDKDKDVRATTADVLKDVRPARKEVIDALIEALADENGLVQAHAARTLGALAPDAVPAVPALTKMLASRNGYPYPDGHPYFYRPVAEMAARALGQIGPPAKAALPSLLDTIRDRNGTFEDIGTPKGNEVARAEAAEAAARIDPRNDELARVLNESLAADPEAREGVAWALAAMGPAAAPAHSRLVELLREDDSPKMPVACAVLGIDPKDSAAMATLLDALRTGPLVEEQRWPVLMATLQRCDPDGEKTIAALAKYLDGDPYVEDIVSATRALARYGPKAAAALDALRRLLDNSFEEVRREAVVAMWRIAPDPQEFFRAVMKKADSQTRKQILEALEGLSEATPVAVAALGDPSASVRLAAISALDPSRLEPEVVRTVRGLLEEPSRSIREAAQGVLRDVEGGGAR